MKRREVITLLGGAAAWPVTAQAQQADRMRRVAVVMQYVESDSQGQLRAAAFREGLEKAGWVAGRNISVDYLWGVLDSEWTRGITEHLRQRVPDAIAVNSSIGLRAIESAARGVPIVFIAVSEPVAQGFVASLAHPGGNMTGFSNLEPTLGAKWLDLLKQIAPQATRIAFIYNPGNPGAKVTLRSTRSAAKQFSFDVLDVPVRDMAEIEAGIAGLAREPGGALLLPPDPFTVGHRKRIVERWVAEKAGGLAVIAGPVFTPQWSGRRRGDPRTDMLKALYPVVFYSQSSATLSLGRFGSEKAWPLQFSRDGLEAEFLWLDENAAASEKAWQQFEGVCGYYAVKEVKPGARIYARFGDPDTAIDNLQPIYMAGQFYGSGRVFFMASGEMWRVRAVDDVYFEQFYTKLIRWISEGRLLRDSSRGVLLVDKDRCALGDQIAVRAILEDAQHRPLSAEQVQAVLVQPDSTRAPLTLKKAKDEGRGGVFVEQFTALQEGDYQIQLQHPAAADQVLVREVRVKIPAKETEFPERNDALLRDIADKTGGDYYVGVAAAAGGNGTTRASLAQIIKPQDQSTILPGTPDRAFERQLMGWLLGLICGVLCMEWLLRRLGSRLAAPNCISER
jgi:ABC-type uncharacterized transport system substrate-binding protein